MANSKQAQKRSRQSTARNAQNASQRSRVRTAVKSVRKAIAAGDKKAAMEIFSSATSVIDRIADKKSGAQERRRPQQERLAAAIKAMA